MGRLFVESRLVRSRPVPRHWCAVVLAEVVTLWSVQFDAETARLLSPH